MFEIGESGHEILVTVRAFISCVAATAGLLLGITSTVAADAGAAMVSAPAAAAPSPSPTLGSTEQSNPNQPGDPDSDPDDYSGAIWVVLGVGAFVLLVAGGTLLTFRGRGRQDLRP